MGDDMSVVESVAAMAPSLPRNFVVLEVKDNLIASSRKSVLARFRGYHRTGVVIMGKPPAEFTAKVHSEILEEKRRIAQQDAKKKASEANRKKQLDAKRKEQESKRGVWRRKDSESKQEEDEDMKDDDADNAVDE